jgi:regulator of sigma E protease
MKRGDTEYVISLVPLGGYVKMAGDEPSLAKGEAFEFLSKTPWQRFKIIFCGPLLNYALGFLLFWFVFMVGAPAATNKIGDLLDGYPARTAGLEKGDRILSVDGRPTQYWEDLTDLIHNKKEGGLNLTVERQTAAGRRVFDVSVAPVRKEAVDIFGKKRSVSLIGIAPSDEVAKVKYDFLKSFLKAVQQVYKLTGLTYKSFLFIITGKLSVKESVTGPIGIFIITSKAAQLGMVYLLQMMAVLSVSLAIFNLLPLPVLDGGHILFLMIEKVRGRPLSAKAQDRATQAGMALLIALMAFVFYMDVLKFILKR